MRGRLDSQAGVTSVEVLVAIFIMAVGLISVLLLFPLGMHSMAQAIQDNRPQAIAAERLDRK